MKQVSPVDSQIGRLVAVEVVELEFKDAFVGFSAASPAKYKYDFIDQLNVSIVEAEKNGVLRKIIDSYLK
ncbi:hypothetical protein K4H28_03725 [Deefgea tanakiae]|uniref:Solute-binding protein family 3/N-terminal domain-containing protein n=1 Tax=Deefgea tanakiae TaxID=2865840 RepID=A0ABX8Z7J5_9NEIS|nr:hypothetical protein [Deefgea tanakiae]QZA78538.1 hypothetical protein K4H28_03725 [Deefgea tanakiae]